MIDYTGVKCPVCGRPFLHEDDIVVCPECGAPYHRECYQKAGACVFQDKHGTGEYWTPPKVEAPPHSGQEAQTKQCPRCGKMNYESALFCDRCGQSLTGSPENIHSGQQNPYSPFGGYQGGDGAPPSQGGFPFGGPDYPPQNGGPVPFIFDPMGGVNPAEDIGGVPAGDVAKFVQNNTPYYLPTFRNKERFNSNRFNFCAFLFTGGWMLYRKMYKIGTVITVLMMVINVASNLLANNYLYPILEQTTKNLSGSDSMLNYSYGMSGILKAIAAQPPLNAFLAALPLFLGIIQLGVMIFCGIKGNQLYCRLCTERIKELKEEHPDEGEYNTALQEKGGVNMALAIMLLICHMLITYLPMYFF